MTNDEQIELINKTITKHYNDFKKKMKQFCFLNGLTYSDDVLHQTILKVLEMANKRGLSDYTEKGIMGYIFQSYKLNTYQEHLQEQKKKIDDNINVFNLDIIDKEYSEESKQFADLATVYLLKKVKENFDLLTYSVWRIRYLVKVNGEELNYKKIKEMTNIKDVRKRIVDVNKWIRDNITLEEINQAITNNEIFK